MFVIIHDAVRPIQGVNCVQMFRAPHGLAATKFVDLFPLDDEDGVLHLLEQLTDGRPQLHICLVFQPVDLDALLKNQLRILQIDLVPCANKSRWQYPKQPGRQAGASRRRRCP
jgi:hypothetical protein